MALIEVRELSKHFTVGDEVIHALDGIDLTVEQGDFIAITGASGSGKSTLLYILGLLDKPTGGAYALDGTPVENLDDADRAAVRNRKLGFVFQSFHLLPRVNAVRNVAMPLVYSRGPGERAARSAMEERARKALERVGLGARMNHLPNELSGGQRQRVAIARALVNEPQLVLADEPTGNLDSRTGAEILALFRELNGQGVTIALVTHDMGIAAHAGRRIVLKDGRIVEAS